MVYLVKASEYMEGGSIVMVCGTIEACRMYIWDTQASYEESWDAPDYWSIFSANVGREPFKVESYEGSFSRPLVYIYNDHGDGWPGGYRSDLGGGGKISAIKAYRQVTAGFAQVGLREAKYFIEHCKGTVITHAMARRLELANCDISVVEAGSFEHRTAARVVPDESYRPTSKPIFTKSTEPDRVDDWQSPSAGRFTELERVPACKQCKDYSKLSGVSDICSECLSTSNTRF